ncbi:MAG TPA: dTDP-4-dehydrorhamnose reductase [Burkholderiaceae bacterium]|nr:dTDP-4-dehydrorhamnose reductase [Burkholderiaceae bacterium]
MKILLLGKSGQVGWELQRALAPLGDLAALDRSGDEGLCGDLSDIDGLRRTIRTVAPDVVVNAAAYTAVDKAESDAEQAYVVNTHAVQAIAEETCTLGGWFVHYSTDYVFDGHGDAAWVESDFTNPLSVYGDSKLKGEQAIQASGCRHLIFRTSWVYGIWGGNFIKTILHLATERERLSVIDNQIGTPTGADLIADITAHALRCAVARPEFAGLYHLAASGQTSWHEYANLIVRRAKERGKKLAVQAIDPIPASSYPVPARRPLNSRLNTDKLCESFMLQMPKWQMGVVRMVDELART